MRKLVLRCAIVAATFVYWGSPAIVSAQQGPAHVKLEGFNGSVRIVPNDERRETVIALSLPYERESKSNQIVFRVQSSADVASEAWSGNARVLSGEGILAVLPDGQGKALLFKFPEVSVPSALKMQSYKEFPVYGIARFGEKTPLTQEEIEELAHTGRVAKLGL